MTNSFSLNRIIDEKEVNSSGREVTAARSTPPRKAPETLVFLSNKSIYWPNLFDKNTNTIISPPKCKVCGSFVYIDFEIGLGQCSHCGKVGKVYVSDNINLKKEWRGLNEY